MQFANFFWTRGALPVNITYALPVNNITPTFTFAGGLKTKGNRPMLADQSIPYRNFARGPLGGGPLLKTSGIKALFQELSGIKPYGETVPNSEG